MRTYDAVHLKALRIALKLREGIALVYRRSLQQHVTVLHLPQAAVQCAAGCSHR